MFRSAKKVEISHNLFHWDETKLLKWLTVLTKELRSPSLNHLMSKMFLSISCHLTDDSIDRLLAYASNNKHHRKKNTNKNVSQNINTCNNVSSQVSTYAFASLPKDIYNHIGSYLSLVSSYNLSKTCRFHHRMVLNREYFHHHVHSGKSHCETRTLLITPKILEKMYSNNGNIEYWFIYKEMIIATTDLKLNRYEYSPHGVVVDCRKSNNNENNRRVKKNKF